MIIIVERAAQAQGSAVTGPTGVLMDAVRRAAAMIMLAVAFGGAAAPALGLGTPVGRKRVVMAFAPDDGDPRLAQQHAQMLTLTVQPDGRDLTYVAIVGERAPPGLGSAASLRRRLGVRASDFLVVLLGKDGGVKLRSKRVIDAAQLALTIDAMPMRQEEMRHGRP